MVASAVAVAAVAPCVAAVAPAPARARILPVGRLELSGRPRRPVAVPVAADAVTAATHPARKALVIGIDGCRLDVLTGLWAQGELPNLRRLAAAGVVLRARNEEPTQSAVNWTTLLTSLLPAEHGARAPDNAAAFSQLDRQVAQPFYQRARHLAASLRTGVFTAWQALFDHLGAGYADVAFAPVRRTTADEERDDEETVDAAQIFLGGGECEDPDASFVLLELADEVGHHHGYGPAVPQYLAALRRVDANIGRILDCVRARARFAAEEWLVVVTTDHGGPQHGPRDHGGHLSHHPATLASRQSFLIYARLADSTSASAAPDGESWSAQVRPEFRDEIIACDQPLDYASFQLPRLLSAVPTAGGLVPVYEHLELPLPAALAPSPLCPQRQRRAPAALEPPALAGEAEASAVGDTALLSRSA